MSFSIGFFDLPPCRTCPPHTKCRDGVITDCQESYVLQKEWNGLVCVPDVINLKYAEKVSSEIVSMTETLDGQKICEDKLPGTGAEELREGVRRNHVCIALKVVIMMLIQFRLRGPISISRIYGVLQQKILPIVRITGS